MKANFNPMACLIDGFSIFAGDGGGGGGSSSSRSSSRRRGNGGSVIDGPLNTDFWLISLMENNCRPTGRLTDRHTLLRI